MVRLTTLLMFTIGLSTNVLAKMPSDSTARLRFQKLAEKLQLKKPKLKEDEFEVRIWNKQGLMFGTAQMLYKLTKRKNSLLVSKYLINSDKDGFSGATKLNPPNPATTTLWEQLLHHNILTLPDQAAIHDQLHPRPPKDSTWTGVEADGSVSVHAKRTRITNVIITDGEGYYFEVFSTTGYRGYGYSNPREYIRYKPDIAELRDVVTILNEIVLLFRSTN